MSKHEPPPIAPPSPMAEALRDKIAQTQEENRRLVEQIRADNPEQYVGKPPGVVEEEEYLADKAEERAKNNETPVSRAEYDRLKEQLAEQTRLVQQIAKDRGGYNMVPRDVQLLEREEQQRRVYDRIKANGGFCTIVIHSHEDPAQNWRVLIGLNGVSRLLPRGEPVVVSVNELEILDHAIVDMWVKEVDPNGNPVLMHHVRLSYPYSLLDYNGGRLAA